MNDVGTVFTADRSFGAFCDLSVMSRPQSICWPKVKQKLQLIAKPKTPRDRPKNNV